MVDEPDDAALVREAATRSLAGQLAFEALVDRHQQWLVRLLTHLLGNQSDAEDVAQDAFVRAFLAIDTCSDGARFRGWLRVIARRLAFNYRREARTRARYEAQSGGAAASDGELYLQINARSLAGAKGSYTARIAQLTTTAPSPVPTGGSQPPVVSQPDRRALRYELSVPSEKAWTDTGVDLLAGDTLRITAEGTINYTSSKTCGPDGGKREWGDLLKALPVNDVGRVVNQHVRNGQP